MSWRFRRTLKIAPGIRLNLGKRGVSATIGGRLARITMGPSGNRVGSSVPGMGLYYSKKLDANAVVDTDDTEARQAVATGPGGVSGQGAASRWSKKRKVAIVVGVLAIVGAIAGASGQGGSTSTAVTPSASDAASSLATTTTSDTIPADAVSAVLPLVASTVAQSQAQDVIVYVTATGEKYHRAGCSSLSKSKIPISLSEAIAQGYTPCSRCDPPQ